MKEIQIKENSRILYEFYKAASKGSRMKGITDEDSENLEMVNKGDILSLNPKKVD